jgi:glycolate oxidase FAD binding subunit
MAAGLSRKRREEEPVLANMRPVDEREFARLLAEATGTTTPVALVGGGSKTRIGRPMNTAATVSTKGLRGVTLYEPSEMVMSARAGTPLSQVEDALAARRQMLAFEPIELAVCSPPTCPARGASVSAPRATICWACAR